MALIGNGNVVVIPNVQFSRVTKPCARHHYLVTCISSPSSGSMVAHHLQHPRPIGVPDFGAHGGEAAAFVEPL
jgi:hypothetical protein